MGADFKKKYPCIQIQYTILCVLLLILIGSEIGVQGQRQHQHYRGHRPASAPPFSFQTFGSSNVFSGGGGLAGAGTGTAENPAPEYQEQPKRREIDANEIVPLYKQSYPGLYVKGHAPESFKYGPTTQVEHHHGPNYGFQNQNGARRSSLQRDVNLGQFEQNANPYSF